MSYANQNNAWFDKQVTIHWVNTVLWPWHQKRHGDVYCVLLLDNCTTHVDLDKSRLPSKLLIEFFPPNCTSFLQPADIRISAGLEVGYKVMMLKKLLTICDDQELYEEALKEGKKAGQGCKGIDYGGKAYLLDARDILISIWDSDYLCQSGFHTALLEEIWNFISYS